MPIKLIGFPETYNPRIVTADFVPMSERIRAYTDESEALETTTDCSYDDASADVTDVAIDFHVGVMDVAEMRLAKLRASSKPKEETKPQVEPTPQPAEPAGNPE